MGSSSSERSHGLTFGAGPASFHARTVSEAWLSDAAAAAAAARRLRCYGNHDASGIR